MLFSVANASQQKAERGTNGVFCCSSKKPKEPNGASVLEKYHLLTASTLPIYLHLERDIKRPFATSAKISG